ncbi:MAG: PilW family protein [Aquabacterium sp.]|nr:PilW family protein [Aquabacterium sp.]
MSTHTPHRHARAPMVKRQNRGLSLIEIMVSLAIGLVVIGAVFANYINNSMGSRQTAAMTQVANDAALAFGILRNHIAMAGYSTPTSTTPTGFTPTTVSLPIFGCEGRFDKDTDASTDPLKVTCATGKDASTSDALLIRFEVDAQSVPTASYESTDTTTGKTVTSQTPTDCQGNGIVPTVPPSALLADSRFQIDASTATLTCLGNGKQPRNDPLVENIAEMHLTYGVAADVVNGRPTAIIRYITASDVAQVLDSDTVKATKWARVVSTRICLVVRSAEEVLNEPTPYRNCAQDVETPTDRRIYRAFTSTVVLNNRVL